METRGYAPGWLDMSFTHHNSAVCGGGGWSAPLVSLGSRRIPGSWIQKESEIITPRRDSGRV